MARIKIKETEIMYLWNYYFGEDAPATAKRDTTNVIVAIATKIKEPMFRRGDRLKTEQLVEFGRYFAGLAIDFQYMHGDDFNVLTIDTGNGFQLFIIPFRTESDDPRVIDAVVALYGQNLSSMAFVFQKLSEKGWDYLGPTLP